MMKQDPVLMFNSDEEQDLMLDESLNLFETSSLIDSGDSAIHLSLDDLANFAQPMVTIVFQLLFKSFFKFFHLLSSFFKFFKFFQVFSTFFNFFKFYFF